SVPEIAAATPAADDPPANLAAPSLSAADSPEPRPRPRHPSIAAESHSESPASLTPSASQVVVAKSSAGHDIQKDEFEAHRYQNVDGWLSRDLRPAIDLPPLRPESASSPANAGPVITARATDSPERHRSRSDLAFAARLMPVAAGDGVAGVK